MRYKLQGGRGSQAPREKLRAGAGDFPRLHHHGEGAIHRLRFAFLRFEATAGVVGVVEFP